MWEELVPSKIFNPPFPVLKAGHSVSYSCTCTCDVCREWVNGVGSFYLNFPVWLVCYAHFFHIQTFIFILALTSLNGYMFMFLPLPLSPQTPPTSIPRVLSQELGESEQDSSAQDHTPLARRKLVSGGQEATTGERKEGEGAANFHLDPRTNELEQSGFESRPSSVVMKGSFGGTLENTNLHTELFQRDTSPSGPDKSRDTHVTPPDDHETSPEPNNTALSHLTNDILTYSAQVSRTTGDNASQTPWLQSSQNEDLRPSSPMAVNRVFKVVFLGEKFL